MEFSFPSVTSEIIDNSYVSFTAQGFTDLLQVIIADKGQDNKLVYKSSVPEYLEEFGDPNFRVHGQARLNDVNWLNAGGGGYFLRISPDDATFSHVALNIGVKLDGSSAVVKPSTVEFDSPITSHNQIEMALNSYEGTTDAEGFKNHVLFAVVPTGRGKYYNDIGIHLEASTSMDGTYDFRLFNFSVVKLNSTGSEEIIDGPFQVSLEPNATFQGNSFFIENVVNRYSKEIKVYFNEGAWDELSDNLMGIDPQKIDITSPSLFDVPDPVDFYSAAGISSIVWASNEDLLDDDGVTVIRAADTSDPKFHEFKNVAYMTAGSNGDDSWENLNTLKVKAYNGIIDPNIANKREYPAHIILDSNESIHVKQAMHNLAAVIRQDCMAILDMGFTANPEEALQIRREQLGFNSFYTALFAQDYWIYDMFSGNQVHVTSTNYLASKIPNNDGNFGRHKNFVGPRRGVVTGGTNYSWFPNDRFKELMYKNRVNYIERMPKYMAFATQNTSQVQMSALSDINHVRALLDMQRAAEEAADDYRMEDYSAEVISNVRESIQNILNRWVSNGACEYIAVSISPSDYDRQIKRLVVSVNLKFTSIIERIHIKFVVNK